MLKNINLIDNVEIKSIILQVYITLTIRQLRREIAILQ